MASLFRVFYDGFSASDLDQLRVDRKWGLPGVKCSVCQETWATTGIAYPSVDLTTLPAESQYRQFWPVSLEEFEERRRPVLGLIPDGSMPPPGTEFGPLMGTGRGGSFADFVWVNPWTLLAQSSAWERLRTTDVKLPKTVPASIRFKKPNVYVFVELELEPRTLMARSAFGHDLPQCKACGRVQAQMPDNIVVKQSSIPSDVDIFRDRLMPTLILATDPFVQAVKRLQLTGLEFSEVQTV